jgi:hypothetical protein
VVCGREFGFGVASVDEWVVWVGGCVVRVDVWCGFVESEGDALSGCGGCGCAWLGVLRCVVSVGMCQGRRVDRV